MIFNNKLVIMDSYTGKHYRRFDSYDFATLYTNIPHNALKNNIRSLVREAFKISYVVINYNSVFLNNYVLL